MNTTPTYQKIIDYLTSQIYDNVYSAGQKLPTENALAKQFNTSRPTVVKAMDRLRDLNIVYRVQGKGSFVREDETKVSEETSKVISLVLPFSQYRDAARIDEMNILKGASNLLTKNGYYMLVHYCRDSDSDFLKTMRLVRSAPSIATMAYVARGLVESSDIYDLFMSDYPLVFVDKPIVGCMHPCIHSDNIDGVNIAVNHLIDCNYSHIYFLSDCEISHSDTIRERYVGFCQSAQKRSSNASFGHFIMDNQDNDQTRLNEVLQHLVNEHGGKSRVGIFCIGDYFAVKVHNALLSMGVNVPHDFGVVGFDGLNLSTANNSTLTTVEQDFYSIGKLSAETMIKILSREPIPCKDIVVPVKLLVGDTTSTY